MAKRDVELLERQALNRASKMGGLVAILFATRTRRLGSVEWDPERLQFIVGGKIIPVESIKAALEDLEGKIVILMIKYANLLASGEWTIKQWKDAMSVLIEDSHSLFAGLAVGSLAVALSNPITERKTDRDLIYLDGFVNDLMSRGPGYRKSPTIANRARGYIRSAYVTFNLLDLQIHIAAGYTEAMRIRRAAESCTGCIHASGVWIPIREIPPIGTLECGQFCKCFIIYRKT